MSIVLSDSTHRAGKRYRCWYCGQLIERGDTHGRRAGVSCGDFWTMRYHPECDAWACEHWNEDDWEIHDEGEFTRPMTAFDPCI